MSFLNSFFPMPFNSEIEKAVKTMQPWSVRLCYHLPNNGQNYYVQALCILQVLSSHLNLTTFLKERYDFYFHWTEEIQLVKKGSSWDSKPGSEPQRTSLLYSLPNQELLTEGQSLFFHLTKKLPDWISLPASMFTTAFRNPLCTHSNSR